MSVTENIDTKKEKSKKRIIYPILILVVLIGICFSLWFFLFKPFKAAAVTKPESQQSIKSPSKPKYFPSPYIGMTTNDTPQGLEVSKIISGGPADKAGLVVGDYIQKLSETADFSNPTDIDSFTLLSIVQNMQDGESLYFQVKRGDQILNKNVIVQHTADNPIWFSEDVSRQNFLVKLPEINLDNIIRGWKIDNIAQNGKGYGFSDPANSQVKLSLWEMYNAYFDHSVSAEGVLQSLIPPSVVNYRKITIGGYPAVIYTQPIGNNDELNLRVTGDSGGAQMGVALTVPKAQSPKYQDIFNKIIDSVNVYNMNGKARAALLVTINSKYDPSKATVKGLPAGADVVNVVPDGPAYIAGIRTNDIITKVNDVAINGAQDLTSELWKYNPGDTVNVTVFRNFSTLNFYVTLGEIKDNG